MKRETRSCVGIICAMQSEIEELKNDILLLEEYNDGGMQIIFGQMEDHDVVAAVSGEGKVAASACTYALIKDFGADEIINIGVAGSLSYKLSVGDVAIATDVVQYDMDVSALGFSTGQVPCLDVLKIPCDTKMRDSLQIAAEQEGYCLTGTIASGDRFVHAEEDKIRIAKQFDAIAAEMEGAAVGQICYMNHIPFAVLRVISDNASSQAPEAYQRFERESAKLGCSIVRQYIRRQTA